MRVGEFGPAIARGLVGVPRLRLPLTPAAGRAIGAAMAADVRQRFVTATDPGGRPWRPLKFARPSGPGKPLRDTGLLVGSITHTHGPDWVAVGTNHPGAGLHQFGGTVTPRGGKYLAIPLTRQAKRAGSPRRFPGKLSPRIGKRGGVMVDGRGVAQFALVKSVAVPARPFLGLSDGGWRAVADVIAELALRDWM